jgi:NAD(P)-dependent dehydrogenase (short-subunit alcohol dehydrogenase family)
VRCPHTDQQTIDVASAFIEQTFGKLDVLVNNAGISMKEVNDNRGSLTVEQGAARPVRFAMLPADGPTGGFFMSEGAAPW